MSNLNEMSQIELEEERSEIMQKLNDFHTEGVPYGLEKKQIEIRLEEIDEHLKKFE